MKKSELIQKLIDIEIEKGDKSTITIDYIEYLKMQKRLIEMGDVEIR